MSDTQKKPKVNDSAAEDDRQGNSRLDRSSKMIRRINPLGMRVVVKILSPDNMTETGLYLPEGAKASMQESLLAEVQEVASAIDEHDEETNVSGIPLGATVLIPKNAGVKVPWDDTLRIVETKEVLGTVNEMRII